MRFSRSANRRLSPAAPDGPRRAGTALILAVVLASVAACGGSGSDTTAANTTDSQSVTETGEPQPGESPAVAPALEPGQDVPSAAPAAPGGGDSTVAAPSSTPKAGASAAPVTAPLPGSAQAVKPQKCTGSEAQIAIGTVGIQSGVVGGLYRNGVKALQAWVSSINDQGGIACHKIKHLIGDDGNDPARNQALVRQFVEQDHVVAFVFNGAPLSGQASRDYLNQKNIPVIGQEGGQMFWYDSPMHFPVTSNGKMMQYITAASAIDTFMAKGAKKAAAITCEEAEYCRTGQDNMAKPWTDAGGQIVYKAQGSLVQPDFTAQCLGAKNAGAEVILGAFDAQSFHRLKSSCARVGYHPYLASSSIQSQDTFKDDPNMEGDVVGMNNAPWFRADIPGVARYQATILKYLRNVPSDAAGIIGWGAALAFEHAAKKTFKSSQTPTTKDVLDGLYALNGDNLEGVTYPLYFKAGQAKKEVGCYWPILVGKGKFLNDTPMRCMKGYQPQGPAK